MRHYVKICAEVKPVPFTSQTTSPGSSPATLLSPATVSLCGSTARATPLSPSSLPSTGAAGRGCAVQTQEPTTTAAPLLLLYRCILYTQIHRPFPLSLGQSYAANLFEAYPSPICFPLLDGLAGDCYCLLAKAVQHRHHLTLTASFQFSVDFVFDAQKLLSECQSHRDCQLPVHHLLFGQDPCPGTTKYLHVDYKCKPSESCRSHWSQPLCNLNPPPSQLMLPVKKARLLCSRTEEHSYLSLVLIRPFPTFVVSLCPLIQLNTKDTWCVREGS